MFETTGRRTPEGSPVSKFTQRRVRLCCFLRCRQRVRQSGCAGQVGRWMGLGLCLDLLNLGMDQGIHCFRVDGPVLASKSCQPFSFSGQHGRYLESTVWTFEFCPTPFTCSEPHSGCRKAPAPFCVGHPSRHSFYPNAVEGEKERGLTPVGPVPSRFLSSLGRGPSADPTRPPSLPGDIQSDPQTAHPPL